MSTIILQEIGRISSKCGSREENEILKLRVTLSTRKTQHKIAVSVLHSVTQWRELETASQ